MTTELRALLDDEQEALWSDFWEALRTTANGIWSIGCESKAHRLVRNIEAIGPIDHDRVDWRLYTGGLYDMLVGFAGAVPEHLDQEEFERVDARMVEHFTTGSRRALTRPETFLAYAPTRQQMLRYRKDICEV